MKSIEEQTREAAENHYTEWNKYPSNGVKGDCMDDFIAGAEWERNRDKWISVKDELPENGDLVIIYHSNTGVNLNIFKFFRKGFNGVPYPIFSYMNNRGCLNIDDDNITHWQPLPEPPKKEVKP